MNECRWKRPTRRWSSLAGGHGPHLIHDDGDETPCGGAECKDRRENGLPTRRIKPEGWTGDDWWMPDDGSGVPSPEKRQRENSDRRDRRDKEKGERRQGKELRKYDGTGFKHRDSGHSLGGRWHPNRRSGQDRRRAKPAEGIVESLPAKLRDDARDLRSLVPGGREWSDTFKVCARNADTAATHIEQQAAEIQRLREAGEKWLDAADNPTAWMECRNRMKQALGRPFTTPKEQSDGEPKAE